MSAATINQVRRVRGVERYREPHLLPPGTGANPGPDSLRQGANFADATLPQCQCTKPATAVAPMLALRIRTFRLRFPIRFSISTCSQTAGMPGAASSTRCRCLQRTCEGFSRDFGEEHRKAFVAVSPCRNEHTATGFVSGNHRTEFGNLHN